MANKKPTHNVTKVVDSFSKEGDEYDTDVTETIASAWESDSTEVITVKVKRDTILLKGDTLKIFRNKD